MGFLDLFKSKNNSEQLSEGDLLSMGNVELRDVISDIMMKEAGRKSVQQCVESFRGAKRTFYVVSLYDTELATDGLCRFLVGPGRSAAPYIYDALVDIHASKHAGLLRTFTRKNGINLADLSELEISNSWEYEERKKMFPFAEFDEKYEKLYDDESIENRLMSFVRNNIREFVG